jgi:DME family drug/metabolite transporter
VTVGATRIVLGGALLALIGHFLAPRSERAWPLALVLASGGAVALYQLSFFEAVDRTGVAIGTVVALGSAPALAGVLARVVDGTPLGARWAGCTALATAGVLLLVLSGAEAEVSAAGIGLALLAGASYALYTVASKRLLEHGHAPEAVMAWGFGLAALALLPVLAVVGLGGLWSPEGAALVLYLAAIPTALAYVLFARGLRRLTAGETATLTLAEPLTASVLGALVLGERPGALAVVGAALVLAGLAALALPDGPLRRLRRRRAAGVGA